MTDLTQQTAAELSRLYRKGKASPVETMKAVLARTEKVNPVINAFTRVDGEAALKMARASEKRWKKGDQLSTLDGIPVSIKELVRVKGWPASRSRATAGASASTGILSVSLLPIEAGQPFTRTSSLIETGMPSSAES